MRVRTYWCPSCECWTDHDFPHAPRIDPRSIRRWMILDLIILALAVLVFVFVVHW